MNKWIILFFAFGAVVCEFVPNQDDVDLLDSIRDEKPCLSAGGRCVFEPDCPSGAILEERGLCPAQAHRGVECCYGMSKKEFRCKKFGGDCDDYCPPITIEKRAKDCPSGQQCCVYL